MLQNVVVPVISADFEEDIVRPIPLVEQFLDDIVVLIQSKSGGTFVTRYGPNNILRAGA